MQREQDALFRWFAAMADAVVIALSYVLVLYFRIWVGENYNLNLFPSREVLQAVSPEQHWGLVVVVVPIWLYTLRRYRTYAELRRVRADVLLLRLAKASGLGLLFVLFSVFVMQIEGLSRTVLVGFAALVTGTLFFMRLSMAELLRRRLKDVGTHNILVVGSPDEVVPLLQTLRTHEDWGIRILGVIRADTDEISRVEGVAVMGTLDSLPTILEQHTVHQVFMTGRAWDTETLRHVADSCEELGVRFSMDANFLGLRTSTAEISDFEGWSVLSFASTPDNADALLVKRAMDITLSGAALVTLAPVFALVALAIKLEDRGPIFFGQERSGLYGETFTMWKFRSMVIDAEARLAGLAAQNEMDGPVFKIKSDPRITRVGAFIRKTSIDEFPQFWNVFKGEMSLVGPRPPIPAEVVDYERWQMRRLSMKPGLTCIWQVSGRNQVDFETWMQLDLQYIDNWSLFLDVKLIAKTVPVVVLGTGAS